MRTGDVRKSPNKAVPYVEWPDGRISADSGDIIRELEVNGVSLNADFSAAAMETGQKLQALAEGPVYYACLYGRFAEETGWRHQKATVKALVPAILSPILVPIIRKSQIRKCADNGFASRADYAKAIEAIDVISAALGDQPFLFGNDISVADCAVWANVMHAAHTLSDNPARHAVRSNPVLVAYIERVAKAADWVLPPRIDA